MPATDKVPQHVADEWIYTTVLLKLFCVNLECHFLISLLINLFDKFTKISEVDLSAFIYSVS